MAVTRLNHAVLYVRDAQKSAAFYGQALGFKVITEMPGAAFMQAPQSTNDHDLGLFSVGEASQPSGAGSGTVGLYHLAWEVDTLDELDRVSDVLRSIGSLVGASDHGTTKSLYAKDIDGIEFEVAWVVPADRLDDAALSNRSSGPRPLDLTAEKARYGGSTLGGIGISIPVAAG